KQFRPRSWSDTRSRRDYAGALLHGPSRRRADWTWLSFALETPLGLGSEGPEPCNSRYWSDDRNPQVGPGEPRSGANVYPRLSASKENFPTCESFCSLVASSKTRGKVF